MKTERIARRVYRTRDAARADVFDYIGRFYNTIRRHSTNGYLSPVEFEKKVGLYLDRLSTKPAAGHPVEMIGRGWENFLARPNGSLSLRFYVQPTMASLLALRAGIQDARQGRQGYLWAILTRPERRLQLLHEGWRGAMTPFLLAIVLDCIYQLMTVRFVYPLELLFTATLLALVPYALLRGLFNRLARVFLPVARSPPAVEPAGDNKLIH